MSKRDQKRPRSCTYCHYLNPPSVLTCIRWITAKDAFGGKYKSLCGKKRP